jgi:hypothetical protein
MIRGLWHSLVNLLRKPEPGDLAGQLEAEKVRQEAKEKWLADEARQTRLGSGTGPGA